ncbi:UNKNOWN [Stylonychia lemnae]|uniref:Uncharacterized protein n=1 Tax=Stylonychia lemnae TaxID=5949 RepID=A0A078AQ31_STYLE|nr:UNKNOWN [Stylonychia lemnae]|eukprot:CDW84480.1 UNKNOWN [Stylonychia lemnae]
MLQSEQKNLGMVIKYNVHNKIAECLQMNKICKNICQMRYFNYTRHKKETNQFHQIHQRSFVLLRIAMDLFNRKRKNKIKQLVQNARQNTAFNAARIGMKENARKKKIICFKNGLQTSKVITVQNVNLPLKKMKVVTT